MKSAEQWVEHVGNFVGNPHADNWTLHRKELLEIFRNIQADAQGELLERYDTLKALYDCSRAPDPRSD